tara:strand:- start:5874 stop:6449 length:576 start_codon:yes stop_codon:yes gene_type:complete
MAWFGKKKVKEKSEIQPSLPKMPKLPELPRIDDPNELPQLPSYPSSSLGKKFSNNVIKEAISGEKVGDIEDFEANESFPKNRGKMMLKPQHGLTREVSTENIEILPEIKSPNFIRARSKNIEPVFVRMDKFEESLRIFEKAREKIIEIERSLVELKSVRDKEENELQMWRNEIQRVKNQFEKIDENLFSKI